MNPSSKELAKRFISRAKAQGMKGKARDRAAIEFFCGAIAVDERYSLAAFLVAARGFEGVEELAGEGKS